MQLPVQIKCSSLLAHKASGTKMPVLAGMMIFHRDVAQFAPLPARRNLATVGANVPGSSESYLDKQSSLAQMEKSW